MTTETKKKKQILTIETIKAQSGIEKEIKIHLDKCPTQAIRSIPLTEWTRELVKIARKLKHTNEEITEWVVSYAERGNWSQPQVSYVLVENGLQRQYHKVSDTDTFHPVELVKTFKKIIADYTQMQEADLIDCDYSPERIVEMAENNLREWTARMNEGELRINKKLTKATIALFKRGSELMQQKELSISKSGDMR